MLTLIIGFDQKSSIAVSKCMITGTSTATVLYNLRRRHPTLELPIIDYELALLFQPLLVLGISIDVSLNVVLSDWTITILLFVVLLGVSAKSSIKGVEGWKKETMAKKDLLDASRHLPSFPSNGGSTEDVEAKCTPGYPSSDTPTQTRKELNEWSKLRNLRKLWREVITMEFSSSTNRLQRVLSAGHN